MGEGRALRVRRTGLSAAAAAALLAGVAVVGAGMEAALPPWVVVGVAVPVAGLAGWAGARTGRRNGIRDEHLQPGERVIGTYAVRPPYTEHTPPSPHEGPQYHLRVTTHGVQMWERAVLLWKHPWPQLRVMADGPRLRIHHEGHEAGTMLLERPGALHEVCLTAKRYGAA